MGNSDAQMDYWKECISIAAEECGATLTPEQIDFIADAAKGGHECYGMSFYSPPWSDRMSDIEAEWKAKVKAAEKEAESYRAGAEKAMRMALRMHSDAHISITKEGEVFQHGGRTTQIL